MVKRASVRKHLATYCKYEFQYHYKIDKMDSLNSHTHTPEINVL